MKVCFCTFNAYALFDPNSRNRFGGMEVRATRFARGLAERPGFDVTCVVRDEGQYPRQRFGRVSVVVEPPAPEAPAAISPPEDRPRGRRRKRAWSDNVYLRFRTAAERIPGFPWVRIHRWDFNLLWQVPVLALNKPLRLTRRRLADWWFRQRPPMPPTTDFYASLRPDVVCAFGVNEWSARVIASCRKHGQQSLLFLASDHDLLEEYYYGSPHRGPHQDLGHYCWYALHHADQIVVQTERQREQLRARFGRDGVLIRNPLPQPAAAPIPPELRDQPGPFMLWVGRAERANKRPELCVELARRCPQVPFVAVMNRSDPSLFRELCAAAPPNMRIIESVPFDRIDAYFARSLALVNTSIREGFPNTFLQAAAHGVPILSLLVDPDNFISRNGCGVACGDDIERLAAETLRIASDKEHRDGMGAAGRRYVAEHHDLEGRVDELADLLSAMEGPKIVPFALRTLTARLRRRAGKRQRKKAA